MRKVSTKYLKAGMKIARSVYDSRGRLLLADGLELTESLIRRLSEMEIGFLYVEDELFAGDVPLCGIVNQRTRIKSVKLLKETFKDLKNKICINMQKEEIINSLIEEILGNCGTLINFYEIRTYDAYTFCHSVNVCILSLLIGIILGYDRQKLKDIGIGALLHDIGKIKISRKILNKREALTSEELRQIRRHPTEGFNILRRFQDIPLLSANIVLQHHERLDGGGYPYRLSGDEIHEYARIVMIADVFDAMTSHRPYRAAYPVVQAADFIALQAGRVFEADFVTALFSNILPLSAVNALMLNRYSGKNK